MSGFRLREFPAGWPESCSQVLPELEAEKSFVSALHQGQSLPLDQVIARIALELQRIAGDDVTYSAATAHEHNGVVYREILYAFRDTAFGVAAGHAAVNLMTQLAQASRGDGDTQTTGWTSGGVRRNLLSWIESRSLDISTAAMVRGAIRRDIPWRRLNERARFAQF